MVFACADRRDECLTGSDCNPGSECQVRVTFFQEGDVETSPRECAYGAVCGRPFLVDGAARTAAVESRSDWAWAPRRPDLQALGSAERASLATHWADLGLMEHASVAAFARFVLELMAAGAPSELVASAQQALGDEVVHARLCFGLASEYAATPLGPGALSAQGALDDAGLDGCLVRAIHEACVGETLAAVEALEALASASDPAVIDVLRQVVRDESAHAELGWKFLKWALQRAEPELRQRARAELERAIDRALAPSPLVAAPAEPVRTALEQHGLCPKARLREARRQAVRQIVMPLVSAIFAELDSAPRQESGGAISHPA